MFHLFRKDIEKHCAYCKSGSVINLSLIHI